jgi:hypothetical protein
MNLCSVSSPKGSLMKWMGLVLLSVLLFGGGAGEALAVNLDKQGTQWAPFMEWSLNNSSYSGNAYDLVATATFIHNQSGETRTTEMFYDGGNTWKFRFAGTRVGTWAVNTSSGDSDLDGHQGTVTVTENSNPNIYGFVTKMGDKWVRQVDGEGEVKAFVPQYWMSGGPRRYYNKPSLVDSEIDTFMGDHGFTGWHTLGNCTWFDRNEVKCRNVSNRDPDRTTFEALDLMITKIHAAGGVLHIWLWGDAGRDWNPIEWGLNGIEDKRLQRYLAARVGPLPGWTMGYGFDLFEWVEKPQLDEWYNYMHSHMGWPHLLGARSNKNQLNQITEIMDYSSYEQHAPTYDKYLETIQERPNKPSFSEDRFRIIDGGKGKHYTEDQTRRGLWHSAMVGGVANIWGNLDGVPDRPKFDEGKDASEPYKYPERLKANATFFRDRFHTDVEVCNSLTDGWCLKMPDNSLLMFYIEGENSIQMNLSGMSSGQPAIAIDTQKAYAEIDLGTLSASNQTWNAPYSSDWAIAVGTNPDTSPDTVGPADPVRPIWSP